MRITVKHPAAPWCDVWLNGRIVEHVVEVDTFNRYADVIKTDEEGRFVLLGDRAAEKRLRGGFRVTCRDKDIAREHGIPFLAHEG